MLQNLKNQQTWRQQKKLSKIKHINKKNWNWKNRALVSFKIISSGLIYINWIPEEKWKSEEKTI